MSTAAPGIEELSARITGHRFPGGEVSLAPHEVWLGNDAMAAGGGSGQLSALWFLVVALRGMGVTIDELVRIADTTMDGGVLFGELSIEQDAPLAANEVFTVSGGIDGIERRSGRSGVFDVLAFSLEITDSGGARRGRVESSFVLRRRAA